MKRAYLPPILLLSVMLALSLWNGSRITRDTERWRSQLEHVDTLAQAKQWPESIAALEDSHRDWQGRQTYLHIVTEHAVLDDAEAMYHRAAAFARERETAEFRAEIQHLRHQLTLMAEMERFSINNVL